MTEPHLTMVDLRKRGWTNAMIREYLGEPDATRRADASDSPEFLRRITVNYVRHQLTDYDRAYNRLIGRVGHRDAHEILRAEVNTAIEARLARRRRRMTK